MKTRLALVIALMLMGGAVVAQMFPCAIAIDHCWTGRETTQTLNQLFRQKAATAPMPTKQAKSEPSNKYTGESDPFLQWLAEYNERAYGPIDKAHVH